MLKLHTQISTNWLLMFEREHSQVFSIVCFIFQVGSDNATDGQWWSSSADCDVVWRVFCCCSSRNSGHMARQPHHLVSRTTKTTPDITHETHKSRARCVVFVLRQKASDDNPLTTLHVTCVSFHRCCALNIYICIYTYVRDNGSDGRCGTQRPELNIVVRRPPSGVVKQNLMIALTVHPHKRLVSFLYSVFVGNMLINLSIFIDRCRASLLDTLSQPGKKRLYPVPAMTLKPSFCFNFHSQQDQSDDSPLRTRVNITAS